MRSLSSGAIGYATAAGGASAIVKLTEVTGVFMQGEQVIINEDSKDVDFRVESNNNANAIFVNGGTDSVTIGAAGVTHFLGGIAVTSENNSINDFYFQG